MADAKEIIIRIVDGSGAEATPSQSTSPSTRLNDTTPKGNTQKALQNDKALKASDVIWTSLATKFARDEAHKLWGIAEYYIMRSYRLNEDYIGQVQLQNTINVASRMAGYGLSIYAYAKLGTMAGGPVGAGIGAGLGMVSAISDIVFSEMKFQDQLLIQRTSYNYNLNFTQERAGLLNYGRQTLN